MSKRIEVDTIVVDLINEMKVDYNIKTTKEIVEKCIIFCYKNKVNFNNNAQKNLNELFILIDKLNKSIENLPLNIVKLIDTET